MKILIVFGTRPEAIKMAPVIKLLMQYPIFEVKICVTAQHRNMLDQVLSLHQITPQYDFNLMATNQSLTHILYRTMQGLDSVFMEFKPDWVLVQGDTSSAFAAALAAFYNKIFVAHIEAGLRTQNMYSPWPEEINRQLISRIATLHFAPTKSALVNLLKENIAPDKILVTGNTVIDSLLDAANYINSNQLVIEQLKQQFSFLDSTKKLILVTSHRRENWQNGLYQLCDSLVRIATRHDIQIVYPVHLNPNVLEPVNKLLANITNIYLLPPQEYLPFIYLMMQSHIILTDSGGVQEEAPTLDKPVLVIRNTTERFEGIQAGTTKLIGTQVNEIVQHIETLLDDHVAYEKMRIATNPYGDGKAAQRIVERLRHEVSI